LGCRIAISAAMMKVSSPIYISKEKKIEQLEGTATHPNLTAKAMQ
jgi:hypothetical protein